MADIKQAAKWIQQGYEVKRQSWKPEKRPLLRAYEYASDVLADDWIIIFPHQRGDKVKIVNGRLEGLEGVISDIDTMDHDRPLAVEIHCKDFDGHHYCHYTDVQIQI